MKNFIISFIPVLAIGAAIIAFGFNESVMMAGLFVVFTLISIWLVDAQTSRS